MAKLRRRIVALVPVGLIMLVLWSGIYAEVQAATVYRWEDEQGRVHFSDTPRRVSTAQESERLTVEGPPRQPDAAADRQQRQRNRSWFEQRTQERQAEEAARARQRAKADRARQQWQQRCDRARGRLQAEEVALRHKKRTGLGITPAQERKHLRVIEKLRSEAEQTCS